MNFIELDPPHSGVVIAQAVMECLAEWKIEDKVISLTLDNASSNDVAAKNLMAKFVARKVPGFLPNHFHVRGCAHIANLVVNDGLQPLLPGINQLRETVKYMIFFLNKQRRQMALIHSNSAASCSSKYKVLGGYILQS